jgi:hypothetical protein
MAALRGFVGGQCPKATLRAIVVSFLLRFLVKQSIKAILFRHGMRVDGHNDERKA